MNTLSGPLPLLKQLKQSWRRFQLRNPGKRFQASYHQRLKSRHNMLRRLLVIGAGLFLLASGIFFLPAPGPGFIIILLGASLLAQESLWLARGLDSMELILRKIYVGGKRWAHGISPAFKILLLALALIFFAAASFGVYRVIFVHWH
ncbi:MAG: hypothetical protein HY081_06340 [Gammaproteobacteria bacterium]|nr:hypothetical protein [Gammaproteobacteria bacterium]